MSKEKLPIGQKTQLVRFEFSDLDYILRNNIPFQGEGRIKFTLTDAELFEFLYNRNKEAR